MVQIYHKPVLCDDVIEGITKHHKGVYLDCTVGGGGHLEALLEKLKNIKAIGIDRDQDAIDFASKRLEKYKDRVRLFKENFVSVDTVLYMAGVDKVDGAVMDLGVSSWQIDEPRRGFSFRFNSILDMRMDRTQSLNAYMVVNEYSEEKLSKIIYEYGEEKHARKIAEMIVDERKRAPIETTQDLVKVISKVVRKNTKNHFAAKTFQAIRIEVNRELEVIEESIRKVVSCLRKGSRFAVISFHSLEDRIVKNTFKELERGCICPPDFPKCVCNKKQELIIITKRPIIAKAKEIRENRRALPAKLRIIEKV